MRRFATVNLVLLLLVVLLANVVGGSAFFRIDLTAGGAYSLSRVSREIVARAEDPIHVELFYSEQVPPPYNGVRRYLLDLLREYELIGRGRFSYEIRDTSDPEERSRALGHGLQQVEIQEVRSDEFQSRAVFLGLIVRYGSAVEQVDRITTTEGLEYRLSSAMGRAIDRVDALAGSAEPVLMQFFLSPGLQDLDIRGLDTLPQEIRSIHEEVNRDTYGRIRLEMLEPRGPEVDRLATEYDVRPLVWQDAGGREERGLLEIILTRGDRHRTVPLEIFSGFPGGYFVDDPAAIEEAIRHSLRTLVAANPRVGYAVGAGELALEDQQQGAAPFAALLGERYDLVPIRIGEEAVPPDIDTLIINGPRRRYSEEALYRVDQFVLGGGALLVFLDRFMEEMPTQQEMMLGAQPRWLELSTGVDELLAHYGVHVTEALVLDEEGFPASSQGRRVIVHQAPVLRGRSLNREHVITRDLENVIVLNATEIRPGPEIVPLLETSPRSWTVEHPSEAGPWLEGVPPGVTPDRRIVAALREGPLETFFSAPPELERFPGAAGTAARGITPERHRTESVGNGRILVFSSSTLTTAQLVDPRERAPNNVLLMNALDYLKGVPAYAELRGKGLGIPRLEIRHPALPTIVRWINIILVPLLVIFVGMIVYLRRRARSRRIERRFRGVSREEAPVQ